MRAWLYMSNECWQVPWPVSIVLSSQCMDVYNEAFQFLLQIKRVKHLLDGLRFLGNFTYLLFLFTVCVQDENVKITTRICYNLFKMSEVKSKVSAQTLLEGNFCAGWQFFGCWMSIKNLWCSCWCKLFYTPVFNLLQADDHVCHHWANILLHIEGRISIVF